jgi:hypothetical protein
MENKFWKKKLVLILNNLICLDILGLDCQKLKLHKALDSDGKIEEDAKMEEIDGEELSKEELKYIEGHKNELFIVISTLT